MIRRDVSTTRHRVVVRGHVQGVWFRDSMRREAERLGVSGWVRNLADGSVEAALEGPSDAVDALTRWCDHGPPGARVLRVETRDEPVEGLDDFRIVR
jgi:acylphosphatase